MLTRCPFATWRGEIPNRTPGGFVTPIVGVVEHIMGSSYTAADGWFHNPQAKASAQFGIANGGSGGLRDGALVQWVDLADRAWHAVAANRQWVGVETEGTGGPLTDAQVATFARLYAWLRQPDVFGPDLLLAITDDPNNGHGLGYHQMGGQAWGGHACPGPSRVAQRQRIIDLAGGVSPAPPAPIHLEVEMNQAVTKNGTVLLVGRGLDDAAWVTEESPAGSGAWSGAMSLGGTFVGGLTVVALPDGSVRVNGLGGDNHVYSKTRNPGGTWDGAWAVVAPGRYH